MSSPSSKLRGVFLCMGDYFGTLAAARAAGRHGTPVILGEWRRWVTTAFSRYVSQRVPCPSLQLWEAYIEWLVGYGQARPGLFLYPTSDDTAWLYAKHADKLKPHFHLFQPSVEVIYSLLNKKRLSELCGEVGIDTPPTLFPESDAALAAALAAQKPPFLLKPRTQIGLKIGHKGRVLQSGEDYESVYKSFQEQLVYQKQLLHYDAAVCWPMIQEYFAGAMQSIISVAGFVDREGRIVARSSRKVLQRPRRLGVGLCFESVPVDPELLDQLSRLCKRVGYYGVFEAEFIDEGASGRRLLIDFNPRYYGQMGFEIARGLPLPLLAMQAALVPRAELSALLDKAEGAAPAQTCIYSTRWLLRLSLWTGLIGGKHSWAELMSWRRWRKNPAHLYADAIYDRADPWPYYFDILINCGRYLRHPRDTIRKFFLDT